MEKNLKFVRVARINRSDPGIKKLKNCRAHNPTIEHAASCNSTWKWLKTQPCLPWLQLKKQGMKWFFAPCEGLRPRLKNATSWKTCRRLRSLNWYSATVLHIHDWKSIMNYFPWSYHEDMKDVRKATETQMWLKSLKQYQKEWNQTRMHRLKKGWQSSQQIPITKPYSAYEWLTRFMGTTTSRLDCIYIFKSCLWKQYSNINFRQKDWRNYHGCNL